MQLSGKQVMHKVFGEGKIVQYDDQYVQIEFEAGIKRFIFPDACGVYFTINDRVAADFVENIMQKRKKKRKKEERERLQRIQKFSIKKPRRFIRRDKIAVERKSPKINPCSQSVFWCKPDEIDKVFTEWRVFTGAIKSGQKKGEPRRLARIGQNSVALLTFRCSTMAEKDRQILGLFMVDGSFNVSKCKDGYIPAHPQYRLRLSEQESGKMLFWNYYINKKYPDRVTWNTGRHRYLDNIWVAQILRDIISLKKQPEELELVQHFYKYFCQMNKIDADRLPEPNGALVFPHIDGEQKEMA